MPLSFFYRGLGTCLSPAGDAGRLSILIYHQVLPQFDPLIPGEVTASRFERQMKLLSETFNVLPLTLAVQHLQQGTLPARAACITFDDGYANNYTVALPILKKYGLNASFFVSSAYLNGGIMFNDVVIEIMRQTTVQHLDLSHLELGCYDLSTPLNRQQAMLTLLDQLKKLDWQYREQLTQQILAMVGDVQLPSDLMMSDWQIQQLAAEGMEIGAHTSHHAILSGISLEQAREEIVSNKRYLDALLVEPVKLFAYPNGRAGADYLPEHVELVRELGFVAAVATDWGVARSGGDVYQLPRFTPWHRSEDRFVPMLLRNLYQGS